MCAIIGCSNDCILVSRVALEVKTKVRANSSFFTGLTGHYTFKRVAYLKRNNDYPQTPTKLYNLLVNYKNYSANKRTAMQGGLEQVAFVADGKKLKTGKEFPHIKCFKCGKMGHYKSNCQEKKNKNEEEEVSQEEYQVIQAMTLMSQA
jgi:hypothetical protein